MENYEKWVISCLFFTKNIIFVDKYVAILYTLLKKICGPEKDRLSFQSLEASKDHPGDEI